MDLEMNTMEQIKMLLMMAMTKKDSRNLGNSLLVPVHILAHF
jgi:hypothetical protein